MINGTLSASVRSREYGRVHCLSRVHPDAMTFHLSGSDGLRWSGALLGAMVGVAAVAGCHCVRAGRGVGYATEKDAAQAKTPGQRVADSRAMEVASRVGLCARGVIYVLVGLLAVRIGFGGGSGKEADRSGAVRTIGEQQAAEGGDKWTRRLGSLGLAVFYLAICIGVVQTALVGGSGGTRAGDQASKD